MKKNLLNFSLIIYERNTTGCTIKKLLNHTSEIINPANINSSLRYLFENLFKKSVTKSNSGIIALASSIQLLNICIESFNHCGGNVTEENLLAALKSTPNNKTPEKMVSLKNFTKPSGTKKTVSSLIS